MKRNSRGRIIKQNNSTIASEGMMFSEILKWVIGVSFHFYLHFINRNSQTPKRELASHLPVTLAPLILLMLTFIYLLFLFLPGLGGRLSRKFSLTWKELGYIHSTSFILDTFWKTHLQERNAIKMYLTVCVRYIPKNICTNKFYINLSRKTGLCKTMCFFL